MVVVFEASGSLFKIGQRNAKLSAVQLNAEQSAKLKNHKQTQYVTIDTIKRPE